MTGRLTRTVVEPLNENVLVKVLEEDGGNDSGVLLPEMHENAKFGMGEVLAVAEELPLTAGDKIYFDTLLITNVKIKGEELKFIKFSDILGYERSTN